MIVQDQRRFFAADQRYISALLMLIFGLGTLTLVGLVVGAFIACMYVLNLALNAVSEVISTISQLYVGGDSFIRLVMWLVPLMLVWKLAPTLAKLFRRAFLRVA